MASKSKSNFYDNFSLQGCVGVFCQTLLNHTLGAVTLLRLPRCVPTLRWSLIFLRPDVAVRGISQSSIFQLQASLLASQVNGGCAWGTLGCAGSYARSANPRTVATLFVSQRTVVAPFAWELPNEKACS